MSTADVPPQNIGAEESVLGAMLVAESAITAVADEIGLAAEDLYLDKHQTIFRCIRDLYAAGKPADEVAVVDALGRAGQLEAAGGKHYISELTAKVPAPGNAAHHAAIVQREAMFRRILTAGQSIVESVRDRGGAPPEGLILDAAKSLGQIAPAGRSTWLSPADALLGEPDPGPTPFLVESLLVEGAIGTLVGAYKRGKTFLLLDMAICVGTGSPMFGDLEVKQGPVIIVLEESGRAALHRRLGMLARGRGIDPASLSDLHYAANERVRLDDPAWQMRLLSAAKEIGPALIALDPLVRLKGAADENSQAEMAPILDFIRDLRDASGGAVLFTHHTGHENRGRSRGTSDIEGYWESKIVIAAEEGSSIAELRAEHREAEGTASLSYRRSYDEDTESLRLELVGASDSGLADELLSAIRFRPGRGTEELAKAVKKRPATVRPVLKKLEEAGTAHRAPSQYTDGAGRTQTKDGWFIASDCDARPVPSSRTDRDGAPGDVPVRPAVPPFRGGTGDGLASGTAQEEAA